ncbi:MAG: peroxidase-related enzyme [Paracoccaceae bacterium]
MPRISPLNDTSASPEAAAIFAAVKARIGMVPNLYRTTGHSPATLSALLGLGEALGKGGFTAEEREAVALTVGQTNGCDYCLSAHSAISSGLKVPAAEIAANRQAASATPRTGAILKLARAITEKRGLIADADLEAARAAGLTNADVVETVGAVVQNIFTNYLNHVFATDIDFPVVRAEAA